MSYELHKSVDGVLLVKRPSGECRFLTWKERLLHSLFLLFWKRLCCRPDGGRLHSWWYHHGGNIARFFNRRFLRSIGERA